METESDCLEVHIHVPLASWPGSMSHSLYLGRLGNLWRSHGKLGHHRRCSEQTRVDTHTQKSSDVQAWLKSCEPAGPVIKSHAWAGPSAGLIGAGGLAQLVASVRSTLQVAPSPQRRQEKSCEKKMIIDWLFLCELRSGIPREQNRDLTTT